MWPRIFWRGLLVTGGWGTSLQTWKKAQTCKSGLCKFNPICVNFFISPTNFLCKGQKRPVWEKYIEFSLCKHFVFFHVWRLIPRPRLILRPSLIPDQDCNRNQDIPYHQMSNSTRILKPEISSPSKNFLPIKEQSYVLLHQSIIGLHWSCLYRDLTKLTFIKVVETETFWDSKIPSVRDWESLRLSKYVVVKAETNKD